MSFDPIEITNVVLALALIAKMRSQDIRGILASFFIYGSGYFLFSLIPLFSGASPDTLHRLHFEGSRLIAKTATLLFLTVAFSFLLRNSYRLLAEDKKIIIYFCMAMVGLLAGYLMVSWPMTPLKIQSLVSLELMLALILLGQASARKIPSLKWIVSESILNWVVVFVFFASSTAFYEVFSHRAWAFFGKVDNEVIRRASSFLFNPNLYGAWTAVMVLALSSLWHSGMFEHQRKILLGLVLLYIGLYLSGSRSTICLLVVCLTVAASLVKDPPLCRRFTPLVLMLGTFLSLAVLARALSSWDKEFSDNWQTIWLLGKRIFETPLDILDYISGNPKVAPEIVLSVRGRFWGERIDSGFMLLVRDAGWLGLASMALMILWMFHLAVRTYRLRQDTWSAYALALLMFFVGLGAAMRYQVFPVWLLLGVLLALCMALWRKSCSTELKINAEQSPSLCECAAGPFPDKPNPQSHH